tara:strand:- start:651 stop:884 length:234 start_codon:yes stop_codon:yes gene_type:complete
MKIVNVRSSSEFVTEIESLVKEKKCEYIDAIIVYCQKNNIEVETAAELIKQNSLLKVKLQVEAENNNMVKRSGRLPL